MKNKNTIILSHKHAIFLLFAMFFVLQGTIQVSLQFFGIDPMNPENLRTMEILLFVQQIVIFGVPAIVVRKLQGEGFRFSSKISPMILFVLLLTLTGAILLTPFVMLPKSLIEGSEILKEFLKLEENVEKILTNLLVKENPIITLFLIALLPAVFEELFFRGTLQENLQKIMPSPIAVLLGGFIFSFAHFQIFGFFARWMLGSLFDLVYVKTGNLFYTIFLHFLFNATSLSVSMMMQDKINWETQEVNISFLFIGIFLLTLSLFILNKLLKSNNE